MNKLRIILALAVGVFVLLSCVYLWYAWRIAVMQIGIIFLIFLYLSLFIFYIFMQTSIKMKESENNFKTFFETIDDMVVVADKQGKILYTNQAVTQKLHYSKDDLIGMEVLDLNPKNRREEAKKILEEMFSGERVSCPLPLEKKNGTLIPSKTRIWMGSWNGKDCIFGLSEDLSSEQERTLILNKIFDNNPALMAISSLDDRRFTEVNNAFLEKTGYNKEEVIGKTAQELQLFLNPEEQKNSAEKLADEGHIHNVELRVKTKSGAILDGYFSGDIIESQGKKFFLTVMVDQTENKKAERQLLENKQRLENTIEGTQVGTWEWNIQTGEVVFNEKWAQIIGYTLDELSPTTIKTWETYVYPEDLKKSEELLEQHFVGKLPYYDCEVRMRHKNGQTVWIQDRGRVITHSKNGMPLMMFGTHTEITERKKAEEDIKRNLAQQVLLAEISVQLNQEQNYYVTINDILKKIALHTQSSRSYIFEDSADGTTTSNTFEWCNSNSKPQIDHLQNIPYSSIPSFIAAFEESGKLIADDVSLLSKELRAILEPQNIKSVLIIPLKIKGKRFGFIGFDQNECKRQWSESEVNLLEILSNSISNVYERNKNRTEIKEKANEIEKEKIKIEAIVNNIGDAVFVVDTNLKIILFNPKASKISGFSADESLYKPYHEILNLIIDQDGKINNYFIQKAITTGEIQEVTTPTTLIKKDGSRISVACSANPLKDEKGKIKGCVISFRDVTKERQIEKMKSEFVAVASHQLKTPLAGIKWLSELLLGDKVGAPAPSQKKYLNNIHFSNERMLKLVDDLLNVSYIEKGENFIVEKKECDIVKILNDVLSDSHQFALNKKITITLSKDIPTQLGIQIDELKIRQVFNNLIDNAIKYSKADGTVEIGYEKNDHEVIFAIKDQGIGIPLEQQNRMFEKFFRASNVTIHDTDGTGLGIYIVRAIVEAHGGKIWFKSNENVGSTFYFSLPVNY